MKRTTFGIILCSAVLAISAFFVGRTPETPTFTQRPAVVASAIEVSTASTGSPVVAPEAAAVSAALESAPRAGEARPEALPPQADEQDKPFPGSRVDPKRILALHGDKPLDRNHPHMAAAIEVQERAMARLMAHPAVVGTSVGLNDEGQVAIVILTKSDAADLPRTLENIPVVVWDSGLIFARNRIPQEASAGEARARGKGKPGGSGGGPAPLTPRSRHPRPVPIGVSTSLTTADTPGFITAGTLGCRVKIGLDLYALSNNHVYANEGNASEHAPVLQPGTLDGGVPGVDQIGTLSSSSTLAFRTSTSTPVNLIDAAIAAIPAATITVPLSVGNETPADGYGMPKTTTVSTATSVALFVSVSKYGRTTGATTASVSGINTSVNVGYDGGTAYFEHQILINSRTFSDAGDSGSLIVQSADKAPVGLLFAGGRTTTIANQIVDVLKQFGCEIDGSH